MKIALGQMYVRAGFCDENFTRIKEMVNDAKNQGADILVLPQLCVSGAFLADKFYDDDFCLYANSFNEEIKNLSDGLGIVFGNIYYDTTLKGNDGRSARYNTMFFAKDKKWVKKVNETLDGMMVKHTSVNTHIYDDARYFLNANDTVSPFVFEKDGKEYRIALLHAQDVHNKEVMETYFKENVDFYICADSKNWIKNKEDEIASVLKTYTTDKTMSYFVYVNACGMQNTGKNMLVFDGASCVYGEKGDRVFSLNDGFESELKIWEEGCTNTFVPTNNKLLEALTYALKEVDKQMFGSRLKWIIGLSGGIDSSINAALLVKALGNERIVGYNMASAYNSLTTKNNARILAEGLGVEIREGSIELLNEASLKTMEMYNYTDTYGSLVYENIQARIRGHLLSTFASIEGGVIINNANKIEVALGYCTLYGDAIGAIAPIGDLTKVECFEVARGLNEYFGKEVISNTLIPEVDGTNIKWDMPPSAELKDAQFDPMKWFYHDEIVKMLMEYPCGKIESFMESFIDGSIYDTSMGEWIHYYHLEKGEAFMNDLEWLFRTLSNAVFKRIQMPPIVLLSDGAFGSDVRESQLGFIQTKKYKELKAKILAM